MKLHCSNQRTTQERAQNCKNQMITVDYFYIKKKFINLCSYGYLKERKKKENINLSAYRSTLLDCSLLKLTKRE